LTAFGLAVTLTFDLLTSKSSQFISVRQLYLGCKFVNLVKFPPSVCKISR